MKNIEKEFVPYTEALELKQLGFDEPCLKLYVNGNIALRPYSESNEVVNAPTYSQARRWLREKHGYCSYIKEATKGTYRFYIEKFDEKFFNSSPYKIYEEAELACLRKMIEIVKQKQQ
jgi:hypothetical protein